METKDQFHIFILYQKNGNFKCCVCIYESLYFNHGYKTDTLNANQRKNLNEWLKEKHKTLNNTNWEVIKFLWDSNNEENKNIKFINLILNQIILTWRTIKPYIK